MSSVIYDCLEFTAFIVPRSIQLLLDGFVQARWLDEPFALSLYISISYVCAIGLVGASAWLFVGGVYDRRDQSIVINQSTLGALMVSLIFLTLAGFSAAAPTTGLSLVHCAQRAADFIELD